MFDLFLIYELILMVRLTARKPETVVAERRLQEESGGVAN